MTKVLQLNDTRVAELQVKGDLMIDSGDGGPYTIMICITVA
jgi:hypothetical protein